MRIWRAVILALASANCSAAVGRDVTVADHEDAAVEIGDATSDLARDTSLGDEDAGAEAARDVRPFEVPPPPDGLECTWAWVFQHCDRLYATPDDPRPYWGCCRGRCVAGGADCYEDGWTNVRCGRTPACDLDAGRLCCGSGTSIGAACAPARMGLCFNR